LSGQLAHNKFSSLIGTTFVDQALAKDSVAETFSSVPGFLPMEASSAIISEGSWSVEAILQATIRVLLKVGKERLTTTRVAVRAGVSVGTLYQYFPNKSALLKAALKRHLEEVTAEVERVCREQQAHTLQQMATALVTAFLEAKMRNAKTGVALY
jgi:DNA-binding transcriptional regulator YbjK